MCVSLKVSFLEDLNYIINAGKISNMFENEELDSIVMRVRTFAEQSSCMDDRKYLLSLFQKVLFCVLVDLKQAIFATLYMIFRSCVIPFLHQMSLRRASIFKSPSRIQQIENKQVNRRVKALQPSQFQLLPHFRGT